ncbi:MAG: NADH:flavin oxidoreductase/NADH oxidase [Anaerolineae bacterium]|nr:NADH:flavin oxidoreductase/NADH oxidase [Anaerolineae bacterium]
MLPHLFDPLTLRGVMLRNRIAMSPMCQYSSEDGFANDWHLTHLGSRAVGGVGLIVVEATAVEPRGRITPNDLGLWKDEHIDMLARIVRLIKQHGAVPGIQLAHAGRKAGTARPWDGGRPLSDEDGGWLPDAPSALPFNDGYRTPHALTVEEIKEVQSNFRAATIRALEAGFEVIELHGAHGYLAHSFLSPLSNQRTDEYGGSFDNRTRFMIETVRQMRGVMPQELPLLVRFSATDWVEGGWTLEDSIALASCLKDEGVDMIDSSSGGMSPKAVVPVGPGYQVPLSEGIRHGAGIATAAVGLISSAYQADEIIRNGRADLVMLGRELLRDPYWALHAAQQLHQPLPTPPQYLRAF